ncbi:type II toxin-antitoxin system PemK/MazF family toxin [Dactylosporangium vinaceum]|uniref:Type II toxin-antitoxin system PemK/MazF family toxin n=1 Tax=Dactylosporangium vinaceum TaxID=53362 RepID=A0ABV5MP01_9ACTN|nr:type II toxin-antitoxin system PemK/MazF family toxin [Dactylosporangium vinaceum]UAB95723.1 type II toxin-antitoxin system PemK/MazF family toxin [Dactylosporangium vinaceum]
MEDDIHANWVLVSGVVLFVAGVVGWFVGRAMQGRGAQRTPRYPQPGEVWWAAVPFRETAGEKVRPCLVLRGDGQTFEVLKITSQDKSQRHDHIPIPTHSWDRRATADSYLDLSAPFRLDRRDFHNYAGPVDPNTWHRVIQVHPVGLAPAAAPVPGPGARLAGRALAAVSALAAIAGLLAICAGATVVPWFDGRGGPDAEATAGDDRPLFRIPIAASDVGSSGQQLDSTLAGKHFPVSTGFWVGCEGRAATATYQLDGKWRRLTATAGLDVTAPTDVVAKLVIEVDGKAALTENVSRSKSVAVDLDLTSIRMLTVSAQRTQGSCGNATRPYGALGDAVVHH